MNRKRETKEDTSLLAHCNQGLNKSLRSCYCSSSNQCQPTATDMGKLFLFQVSTAQHTCFFSKEDISTAFPQRSLNYSLFIFTLSSPVLSIKYKQMSVILETRKSIHNAKSFSWFKHLFSKVFFILKSQMSTFASGIKGL